MFQFTLSEGLYFIGDPLLVLGSIEDWVSFQHLNIPSTESIDHWIHIKQYLDVTGVYQDDKITVYGSATYYAKWYEKDFLGDGVYRLNENDSISTASGYLGLVKLNNLPNYQQTLKENRVYLFEKIIKNIPEKTKLIIKPQQYIELFMPSETMLIHLKIDK